MPDSPIGARSLESAVRPPARAPRSRRVGELDAAHRIVRLMLGLLIVDLGLAGIWGHWGWIGVFPIVTGGMGWCPLCALLDLLPRRSGRQACLMRGREVGP